MKLLAFRALIVAGANVTKRTKQYKYKIGDIITNVKSGKLKIIKQIKITHRRNNNNTYDKGYEYQCLKCGNIDIISEYHLKNGKGCNVCAGKKVLVGYNDMWTTNPKLASLLANPEDGYKYTQCSSKNANWKCPNCGNIIDKVISNVTNYVLNCPKCSDNISYPEKFIFNVLQQLKIDFIYQLTKVNFKWCDKYRYDFYFEYNNERYIIEANGLQHYKDCFKAIKKARTLFEEQENDRIKKELAINNGIKKENYIIIDCRKSDLEFIKNNILNSRLNDIFDLSKIDWQKCHEFACNSLVKIVCELWNNELKHSIIKIAKRIKLERGTIRRYLKQGANLGWCNYNPQIEHHNSLNKMHKATQKQIICINNNKKFNSISEAQKEYNIDGSSISACCNGKRKSAGKNPTTGEKLEWKYL